MSRRYITFEQIEQHAAGIDRQIAYHEQKVRELNHMKKYLADLVAKHLVLMNEDEPIAAECETSDPPAHRSRT